MGPGGQQRSAGGREKGKAARQRAPTGGPDQHSAGWRDLNIIQIQTNSNYFKTFQILAHQKAVFPSLKNLK
jgi:hypothetical protein